MEAALQAQTSIFCRHGSRDESKFSIKPFFGFFYKPRVGRSSLNSLCEECPRHGLSFTISASAEFSRKRHKKVSTPRSRGAPPKGFMPKAPSGPGTQKREQRNKVENESAITSTSGLDKRMPDTGADADHNGYVEIPQELTVDEVENEDADDNVGEGSLVDSPPTAIVSRDLLRENGSLVVLDKSKSVGALVKRDVGTTAMIETRLGEKSSITEADESIKVKYDRTESEVSGSGNVGGLDDVNAVAKEANITAGIGESMNGDEDITDSEAPVLETAVVEGDDMEDSSQPLKLEMEEELRLEKEEKLKLEMEEKLRLEKEEKLKLEMEAKLKAEVEAKLKAEVEAKLKAEMEAKLKAEVEAKLKAEMEAQLKLEKEARLRKQVIEQLAQDNYSKGNRLFTYPKVVKPDQDIEVFLNRSLSSLKDEPDVMIMGGFNDWRWSSFTIKLDKTHINGDWWACKINVPKQAYKIDFVFFNGKDVYDNNGKKDFHILVDGGMDPSDFEDFLLEEKQQEQEKLAREQAERERQAEEQRRTEAARAAIEADRAQARAEVEKRQDKLRDLLKKAATSVDNVWYFALAEVKGEERILLYYNRSSGPLAQANDVWIHGGYNGWQDGLSFATKLLKSERQDTDWWYAEVIVPDQAIVLDWVFADGPPKKATMYDNNRRQDFHGILPKSVSAEKYWVEEEHRVFKRLQEERRLREEAARAKAEKTARMKAETKERTLKRFLLSQKHIVYTDPLDVQAGSTVAVYYNPANTVLNGKPEIWFRCSFNRWTHRKGPLLPQKMVPAENTTHMKTTVKVPLDAYMMDFVFSERKDGGIFDNRDGMDYHIPVSGGIVKEPPLHIVHIAVEMAPIAKVGGLGDVVTSLSRAVQDLNHHVDIVLPKYDCMNLNNVKDLHYQKSYSWSGTEIKVWFGKVEGLSVYFLEPVNGLFWTGYIYGGRNDSQRFEFFCHAALEFLLQSGFHPDILHCHDWSSAPVAWLYKEQYMHYGLSKTRVVFTIHNLEFGSGFIGKAMALSDKATTVSRTYSKEVSGHAAVAPHLGKFHGIVNGIDPDIWDPYNDKHIPVSYTSENVVEGKQAAKKALQQKLGLKTADLPLVGMITRLTHQKGIHLIKHAVWRTLERNGQVVLLGSAPDPRIQNDFVNLANQLHSSHADRARLVLTYDEPLSHLIYAGADIIVVPSIFEPCGLTQLVAMRYGSIPVVRKTGGLYDTVFDVDHDEERARSQGLEPNGFSFEGADAAGVDYALNRAISAWYDSRDWFLSLCKCVMEQDWSWNRPALDYLELYHAARKWNE